MSAADVEKSWQPSFTPVTNGKAISSNSFQTFLSACFPPAFPCGGRLFRLNVVQSQAEASMELCHCLLSFTTHFEPWGAKLMSYGAEAPVKGGFLIRCSF